MKKPKTNKLQTLWIDHKGGLTARKKDGYSMPLYSATDVDVEMKNIGKILRLERAVSDALLVECKKFEREIQRLKAGVKP